LRFRFLLRRLGPALPGAERSRARRAPPVRIELRSRSRRLGPADRLAFWIFARKIRSAFNHEPVAQAFAQRREPRHATDRRAVIAYRNVRNRNAPPPTTINSAKNTRNARFAPGRAGGAATGTLTPGSTTRTSPTMIAKPSRTGWSRGWPGIASFAPQRLHVAVVATRLTVVFDVASPHAGQVIQP
jgi:hypothetical protein